VLFRDEIASYPEHHLFTQVLSMRNRIKQTGFSDWDSMFYNNLLSIPVLAVFSILMEDWGIENLTRNL
jgi:GDP-mannose transporter